MTVLLRSDHPDLMPSSDLALVGQTLDAVTSSDLLEPRSQMAELLRTRPNPLDRSERPGHFTGSALVVDADRHKTLLLFHTKLQIWVQPGGHADGNANLAAVALREATEETGIEGLTVWPEPIDLDIHRVNPPREDAHLHHDVRYLVMAPSDAVVAANHESQAQRWVRLDELAALGVDAGLQRLAARGLELANTLR